MGKDIKTRVCEVVQYEFNPSTGEDLKFNRGVIERAIDELSDAISLYAYIRHDKDTWLDTDEQNNPEHKEGTARPAHWHVELQFKYPITFKKVAKVFGVPVNMVAKVEGNDRTKFLDKVAYLTHESEREQAKGKHLYEDSEITANFDFRKELEERKERIAVYGTSDKRDAMLYKVRYEGVSLKDIREYDRMVYAKCEQKLKQARVEYLAERVPPQSRISVYIYGSSGAGKSVSSKKIAHCLQRRLYPNITDDKDLIFEMGCGSSSTTLMGYDAQPIILWDDVRSGSIIKALGGTGAMFKAFDPYPKDYRISTKFSAVTLVNRINIVTGIEDMEKFLNGLAGEYEDKKTGIMMTTEDKGQAYRRFPVVIEVKEDEIIIRYNKGVIDGTSEYYDYYEDNPYKVNIKEMAKHIEDSRNEVNYGTAFDENLFGDMADKITAILKQSEKSIPDSEQEEYVMKFLRDNPFLIEGHTFREYSVNE